MLIINILTSLFHLSFIFFMILAPFLTSNPATLFLHFQFVVFLLVKWIVREWECGFTLLEHKIRNIDKDQCVMYNVLNPLTDIYSYEYKNYIIIITILLGIISFYRSEMIMRHLTAL